MFFYYYIICIYCFHVIKNIYCSAVYDEEADVLQDSVDNGNIQNSDIENKETKGYQLKITRNILEESKKILREMESFLTAKLEDEKGEMFVSVAYFELENIIADLCQKFEEYLRKDAKYPFIVTSRPVVIPDDLINSSIFDLDERIPRCHFLKLIQFYLFSRHLNSFIRTAAHSIGNNSIKMFLKLCNKEWNDIEDITKLSCLFQDEMKTILLLLSFKENIGCNFLKGDVLHDELYRDLLKTICFEYNIPQKVKTGEYFTKTRFILGLIPSKSLFYVVDLDALVLKSEHTKCFTGFPKTIIVIGKYHEISLFKKHTLYICDIKYERTDAEIHLTYNGYLVIRRLKNSIGWEIIEECKDACEDQSISDRQFSYLMFEVCD